MIGESIAHYRITAKLGEGGMGAVYRATDTKLSREVAIKVLPDAFASDADRLMRFTREAQVLASLNHPNIATIYGIEERAIVMELVEGPTLADRLEGGAIPLDEALAIARQIAAALEAAHEKGVIHRDLKPANIKVTPDGAVKVLDFGLAKLVDPNETSENPDLSPTVVRGHSPTIAGMIMGTAAYMSPEQARGAHVDKRADIWSFGVVLYEMLVGRQLFMGETVSDTLAAVLKTDPDWTILPSGTPEPVRRLLRRALQRDRKHRLPDIVVARLEIDDVMDGSPVEPTPIATAPPQTRWRLWAGTAAFLALLVLTLGLLHFRATPPESRLMKLTVLPPDKTTFGAMALSPDGRLLAFTAIESSGRIQLWARRLDSLTAQLLAETNVAIPPFWSPDSRFIGYFADGKLKKIEASGGPAQTICPAASGRGGAWSRDGMILFSTFSGPLWGVPAAGGEPKAITILDASRQESSHRWPFFLPDGKHFLYQISSSRPENSGIYVGTQDSKDRTRLLGDRCNAAYAGGTCCLREAQF